VPFQLLGRRAHARRDHRNAEKKCCKAKAGRVSQARRDVEQGLAVTLDYFKTRAHQERALQILQFKLDVLWSMSDAMAVRYAVALQSSTQSRPGA